MEASILAENLLFPKWSKIQKSMKRFSWEKIEPKLKNISLKICNSGHDAVKHFCPIWTTKEGKFLPRVDVLDSF